MLSNNAFKILPFAIAMGISLLSCGKDDDGTGGTPCTFTINGTVTDALTGLPIDSIQARLVLAPLPGSTNDQLFFPVVAYSQQSGSYSMEVECQSDFTTFNLTFSDPRGRYYFEPTFNSYKDTDDQLDIELCQRAYVNLHLFNVHGTDSLDLRYAGLKCDLPGNDFELGSFSRFTTDTATIIHLPTSSEISLQVKSFRAGALQQDTTFVFPTSPGDTLQLETIY